MVDTSHGHSRMVIETRRARSCEAFGRARADRRGNVATAEAHEALIEAGVDAREGRHRRWRYLHDAGGGGRWRAADHGDL